MNNPLKLNDLCVCMCVLSIISATVLGALLGAAVSGLAVLLYLTLRRLRVSVNTQPTNKSDPILSFKNVLHDFCF